MGHPRFFVHVYVGFDFFAVCSNSSNKREFSELYIDVLSDTETDKSTPLLAGDVLSHMELIVDFQFVDGIGPAGVRTLVVTM